VDPNTGNRTLVSSMGVDANDNPTGNAGPFAGFYRNAQVFNGGILASSSFGSLVTVDPVTGDRSLFAGGGSGPAPGATGIAIAGNNIYVSNNYTTANTPSTISQVDALTGARTINSGAGVGNGPSLNIPNQLLLDSSGSLLVAEFDGILRIDPLTGVRSLISGGGVGTGPSTFGLTLGILPSGSLITESFPLNANQDCQILSIDPSTGNRTILSDSAHGSGPELFWTGGLAVAPGVPEPTSLVLALLGGLSLLATCRRRWSNVFLSQVVAELRLLRIKP
jgi:hypothetical protein